MPAYTITPRDILFFRDGRPMETAGGHGARWPVPSVIFDALHAALWRAFPNNQRQPWEHLHDWARSSHRPYKGDQSQRFGSLATAGPFPALEGVGWLFPRPQDVTTHNSLVATLLPMKQELGSSDLPPPLLYPLGSSAQPSKAELLPWWTKAAIEAYLKGQTQAPSERWAYADDDLFDREWHTGIAIDPATQTTGHGEAAGKIYAAQYLRLRTGVTLGIHAILPMKNGQPHQRGERITELFPANRTLIVGGQQRTCQVEVIQTAGQCLPMDKLLPVSPPLTGEHVKWLLLSPAVFPAIQAEPSKGISAHPGGWLPNWVAPTDGYRVQQGQQIVEVEKGRVLLKAAPPRQAGESREDWRRRVRQTSFLDCRLVAARIPKPTVLTGWTEAVHLQGTPGQREHGPRPTLLAVPAGTIYYFQGKDAPRLAAALNWHGTSPGTEIQNRRSTLLGEKGYGLGVCGTWNFWPPADPSDPSARSDSSAPQTPERITL